MAPGLSVENQDVPRRVMTGMQLTAAPSGSPAGPGGGRAPEMMPSHRAAAGMQLNTMSTAPLAGTKRGMAPEGVTPFFTNIERVAKEQGLNPVDGMPGVYGNVQGDIGKPGGGLTMVPDINNVRITPDGKGFVAGPAGGMAPGASLQPSSPRQGMAPMTGGDLGPVTDRDGKLVTPSAHERLMFAKMDADRANPATAGMANLGDDRYEGQDLGEVLGDFKPRSGAGGLAAIALASKLSAASKVDGINRFNRDKALFDTSMETHKAAGERDLKEAQADMYRAAAGKDRAAVAHPNGQLTVSEVAGSVDTLARQVVEGRLDPMAISKRGGLQQSVFTKIEELSPGFDITGASGNAKYKTASGNLQSRALIEGVAPLYDNLLAAGQTLGNTRFPAINKVINWAKEQTGNPGITAFNNLRDDMIAESERILMGSGVLSDSKYQRALHNVNSAQSFPQLQAAVKQLRTVVDSRLHALDATPFDAVRQQGDTGGASQAQGAQVVRAPGQQGQARTIVGRGVTAAGRRVIRYSDGEVLYE
jgi:hypothetical protein